MARNYGYAQDFETDLHYGDSKVRGRYTDGSPTNTWRTGGYHYGHDFGDRYSRTQDRDSPRADEYHRRDRSHDNDYLNYNRHDSRDRSRVDPYHETHTRTPREKPSTRNQEDYRDHSSYGNQGYGSGGVMPEPARDYGAQQEMYNSYHRDRQEYDYQRRMFAKSYKSSGVPVDRSTDGFESHYNAVNSYSSRGFDHVSGSTDDFQPDYNETHGNRYPDRHVTSRSSFGQTQGFNGISGLDHQNQYRRYPTSGQNAGPKHDLEKDYDDRPSNGRPSFVQDGGPVDELEPDYDGSDDNEAVGKPVLASSQSNGPPGNGAVNRRGSDGTAQTGLVPGQLKAPSTTGTLRRNTDENKQIAASEKGSNSVITSSGTKRGENSSGETDYEDSDLEQTDPEVLSLRTVDFAKSMQRRRTRNRQPILENPTADVAEVTSERHAQTAQQFIMLYRQHVKEGREQLINQQTKDLTGIKKYKYQSSKRLQKTRSRLDEFFNQFEIWRGAFKTVEGNFGSSVVAYFRFVKWLFLMNLLTFVLILAVVVLPQELLEPDTFNETMDGLETVMDNNYHMEAVACSADYSHRIDVETRDQGIGFQILDVFLGTGWMEETMLFAGYYFNKSYFYEYQGNASGYEEYGELEYNMPVAYLLTTLVYFILILILMVNYTGKGVKDRLVNSGDKFNHCCNMVFCGWDYNLTTEKAAQLKHKNLTNELANDIAEARREKERQGLKLSKKVCLFVVRLLVWAFVLAVWGVSFYLIVMVVGTWTPKLLEEDSVQDSWILTLVVEFLPSLTITAINAVAAPLFQIIVQFEDYTPETEVRVTIARTVTLRLASIGVLSFTLHSRITDCDEDTLTCGNCQEDECWETYVGQEYYKLVVVDFFVIVAMTFLVEFPRKFVVTKFPNNFVFSKVGLQEFELPKNVLEIVYTQTICWIGGFFSPLVPAITAFKLFIFFYVKKLTLMKNCIPATKPYRASKSNYFFMIILMISYGLCLVVIAYAIGRIPPSQSCGPWRVYSQQEYYMYTSVTDAFELLPDVVKTIFDILTNWVLYIVMLIILCLIIYYYQAIASGNKRKVELLKEQLALEGMDKQFLLRQVNVVLQRAAVQPVE